MAGIDQYTVLGCQFDNSYNDLSFAGQNSPHTISPVGSIGFSSTEVKFGSYSLHGTGGFLYTAPSIDWAFGFSDFTIDFWIYATSLYAGCILSQWSDNGSNGSFYLLIGGTGQTLFYYSTNGVNENHGWGASSSAISINTWNHYAIVRHGSTLSLYINGIFDTSANIGSASFYNSTRNLNIGNYQDNGGSDHTQYLKGYLSNLRISKGIARWTSNFTPPTSPYTLNATIMLKNSNNHIITSPSDNGIILIPHS